MRQCSKCGGVINDQYDSDKTFTGYKCLCPCPPDKPLQGWQCPVCKKVHSPFTLSCDCHLSINNFKINVTSSPFEEEQK